MQTQKIKQQEKILIDVSVISFGRLFNRTGSLELF